jgi:hypothetical protein
MKLEKIRWYDSNILHGWQPDIENCWLVECEEVGWVLYESDLLVIIARGISNNFYNSPMAIPKGCIIERKELRVK